MFQHKWQNGKLIENHKCIFEKFARKQKTTTNPFDFEAELKCRHCLQSCWPFWLTLTLTWADLTMMLSSELIQLHLHRSRVRFLSNQISPLQRTDVSVRQDVYVDA